MYGSYIGKNKVLVRPKYGGKLILPADDLSLTPLLLTEGEYQPALTTILSQYVGRGQIVVDVGAHVGYYAVLMGQRVGTEGTCICYEPHPTLYPLLAENLILNGIHTESNLYPLAAYSEQKRVNFLQVERLTMDSTLSSSKEPLCQEDENGSTIEVQGVAICEHLHHLPHIDFLKISVGRKGIDTLLGLGDLMKDKIRFLIFEFERNLWEKEEISELRELLFIYRRNYGKRLLEVESKGDLVEVEEQRVIETCHYAQLVLC
ncbi:FkbM family methyltransferase [Mechercharimyces sp. CAU 1602]|uniref:FkbM family methyltransferase n=1 Tax=Mechercharimyces sp. CAU 1602 TaxID=2973933 RepID=UPI0021624189|nr:FkbM family methyltransferase [Mechercharimyces sp. CAU 1602]MCS1351072.1 FkbM family methyltransferase [Mechercharimyces sp. CAU 1602]